MIYDSKDIIQKYTPPHVVILIMMSLSDVDGVVQNTKNWISQEKIMTLKKRKISLCALKTTFSKVNCFFANLT